MSKSSSEIYEDDIAKASVYMNQRNPRGPLIGLSCEDWIHFIAGATAQLRLEDTASEQAEINVSNTYYTQGIEFAEFQDGREAGAYYHNEFLKGLVAGLSQESLSTEDHFRRGYAFATYASKKFEESPNYTSIETKLN